MVNTIRIAKEVDKPRNRLKKSIDKVLTNDRFILLPVAFVLLISLVGIIVIIYKKKMGRG